MAKVNYPDLFARIGPIISRSNKYLTNQSELLDPAGDADLILSEYNDRRDLVVGIQSEYEGFGSQEEGRISAGVNIVADTLIDQQLNLNAPTTDIGDIIDYIIRDMTDQHVSVVGNTAATNVVDHDENIGRGALLVSVLNTDNEADERPKSQKFEVLCIADRHRGTAAGSEDFSITGFPIEATESFESQGDGEGPTLTTMQTSDFVTGGSFESWTNGEPAGWIIDIGTNPDIVESATAFLGESSMEFQGGVNASIQVSQDISSLAVDTVYCAAVVVASDVTGADTTVEMRLEGDGYIQILANVDPSTLGAAGTGTDTEWELQYAFFVLPIDPPDVINLVIEWTSDGGSAPLPFDESVYIDNVSIAEAEVSGNVRFALYRGQTDFIVNDRFDADVVNDFAGVYQTYFGRYFDKMLPSTISLDSAEAGTGPSTVIDDNLAK